MSEVKDGTIDAEQSESPISFVDYKLAKNDDGVGVEGYLAYLRLGLSPEDTAKLKDLTQHVKEIVSRITSDPGVDDEAVRYADTFSNTRLKFITLGIYASELVNRPSQHSLTKEQKDAYAGEMLDSQVENLNDYQTSNSKSRP